MTELICELGINHLGNSKKLQRMILKAREYGLTSIKFQYRDIDEGFFHPKREMGTTLLEQELGQSNLNITELLEACLFARELGLSVGVSFFRKKDLQVFCKNFLPDFIKIPSAEALNFDLIKAAKNYYIPVIVSTGGLTYAQLRDLSESIAFSSIDVVMYCVANYPASLGTTFPNFISQYREMFPCKIGYSSHDIDWEINIAFIYSGIDFLERHLCENKTDTGLDVSTSSDFLEMKKLNIFCKNLGWRQSYLLSEKIPNQGEVQNIRDLGSGYYYNQNYKAGDCVSTKNLTVQSPCRGVRTGTLLNFKLLRDVAADAPVIPEDFQPQIANFSFDVDALIENKVSLPVRFHDYENIVDRFPLANYEFHLSYKDVESISEVIVPLKQKFSESYEFSIHLPDYISSHELIDPFSKDPFVKDRSMKILDSCISFSLELSEITGKKCPIIGSFSSIGQLSKSDFYSYFRDLLGSFTVKNDVAVIPQFLPKRAWYFGGSVELDVFCSISDIEYYKQFPSGLCLDTAHCIMAANFEQASIAHWLQTLLPLATHLHVSDASGIDGEGLPFGDGDFNSNIGIILAHSSVKVVEQWEGHLHNYRGFEQALAYLSKHYTLT